MRKFIFIALFSLALSLGLLSCGLHGFGTDDLSDSKIVEALQEALFLGSKTAASNLGEACTTTSNCLTGYLGNELVEIALPDTIKTVLDKIDAFTKEIDEITSIISKSPLLKSSIAAGSIEAISLPDFSKFRGLSSRIKDTLNRGAERAAPESVDMFKNAIFEMSFSDARSILFGSDNIAATSYLKQMTFTGLQGIFGGILESCLEELGLNSFWKPYIASPYNSFASSYSSANNSFKTAVTAYNALHSSSPLTLPALPYATLGEDLSGDLSKYATGRALDGLFYMVGVQESKLRADPWGTISSVGGFITDAVGDLLGSVFSKAKEG